MATLTGATIAGTYKSLLKATSAVPALVTGSTTERLVFGEDDAADVRTNLYVSQDRLGIGTASPASLLDLGGQSSPQLYFSSTEGSIDNNDQIAGIVFRGRDADTYAIGAAIRCYGDETWGDLSSNDDDAPTRMQFFTQSNGTAADALAAPRMTIDSTGNVGIGEIAPDAKLCISALADEPFLSFKAENIVTGLTSVAETDTMFIIKEAADQSGGVIMSAISDTAGDPGTFQIRGYAAAAALVGEATDQFGIVRVDSSKHNESDSVTVHATDGNIFTVGNNNLVQFIVKGDGEIWSNLAAAVFDEYDDTHLIRAIDITRKHEGKGFIDSKFDKFVQYNEDKLKELRLIGKDKDGDTTGFVSITGMTKLHNGAIWQQYTEMQKMKELMYETMVELMGKDKADKKLDSHDIKLLNENLLN